MPPPLPGPHPASRRGAGAWAERLGGEGAKREKSLPARRAPLPPHTLGSLKSRFDPLSSSLPGGRQGGRGGPGDPRPHSPPPAETPAPCSAPFPLRTGGFRKVRGKTAARAPSPITTPSPQTLRLGVPAAREPTRERQAAGKLFQATPAFSAGHPSPPCAPSGSARLLSTAALRWGAGGEAQKGSCFQKSHSGLGEELEQRGSEACLRRGFGV